MRAREAIPAGNPSHCSGASPELAKLKVLTLHFPLPESDSRGQGPARPGPTPPTPSTSYRARPRPQPRPFRAEILPHIPASLARVALSEAAPGLVSPSPTLPSPASTPRTSRLAPARSGPGGGGPAGVPKPLALRPPHLCEHGAASGAERAGCGPQPARRRRARRDLPTAALGTEGGPRPDTAHGLRSALR